VYLIPKLKVTGSIPVGCANNINDLDAAYKSRSRFASTLCVPVCVPKHVPIPKKYPDSGENFSSVSAFPLALLFQQAANPVVSSAQDGLSGPLPTIVLISFWRRPPPVRHCVRRYNKQSRQCCDWLAAAPGTVSPCPAPFSFAPAAPVDSGG